MSKPASPALQTGHALAAQLARCFAFVEGSGSVVNDFATGGHDLATRTGGTTAAGTWGTDGTQGGYLTFDGATRDATGPDTGLPAGSTPRTLAILYRSSATTSGYMLGYGSTGDGLLAMGLAFASNDDQTLRDVRVTTQTHGAGGFTNRADNQWHLAHVVIDSDTKVQIFVDGSVVNISTTGLDSPGSTTPHDFTPLSTVVGSGNLLYLGQAGGSSGSLLYQTFDCAGVWVWSRALSGADITAHAADPWAVVTPGVSPSPTLDVTPATATAGSGVPTVSITATRANSSASLAASVSGGGTLSTSAPTSGVAFTWTKPGSGSGTATVTVTDATDSLTDTCVITFSNTVSTPTLDVSPATATATSGGSAVSITATRANSTNPLSASVTGGGTLSTATPTSSVAFTWTPPSTGSGTATVTVAAQADGTSDTCVITFAAAPDPPDDGGNLPYRQVFDLQFSGLSTARVRARDDSGQSYAGFDWSTTPVVELGAGQYRVSLSLPRVALDIEVDDGLGGQPRFDAWNPSSSGGGTDPWNVTLPGSYGADKAGYLLGNLATQTDLGATIAATPVSIKSGGITTSSYATGAAPLTAAGITSLSTAVNATKTGVDTINGTGVKLKADGLDLIDVESTTNIPQAISVMLAALSGPVSIDDNGDDTYTLTFKAPGTNTTRISMVTTAAGERLTTTVSPPA